MPIQAIEEGGQGFLTLLPWLRLSKTVVVGATAFVPVTTRTVRRRLPGAAGATVAALMRRHRDARGHRLLGFTVALHRREEEWSWKTPDDDTARESVDSNRQILALACLAEQEFFRDTGHMNGSMFGQEVQGMVAGQDGITLVRQRRDGRTLDGGWSLADVTIQAPVMIPHSICATPSGGLVPALVAARAAGAPVWSQIEAALPFFILGVSELSELTSHTSAMLLALAFSRLVDPDDNGARGLAERFGLHWKAYDRITLGQAGLVPDTGPLQKYAPTQLGEPVKMKWAKELYETRNSFVHHGTGKGETSNWRTWQHVIAASFAFPLTVKLLLAAAGHYALTGDDKASYGIFDRLLVEGFKGGDRYEGPDWPRILGEARSRADARQAVASALAQTRPAVDSTS